MSSEERWGARALILTVLGLILLGLSLQNSADAAPRKTQYKLTICAHQPFNGRISNDPIIAGKIMINNSEANTTACYSKWYPKGTRLVLHARTVRINSTPDKRWWGQSGFKHWGEVGSPLYPPYLRRGPGVNACNGEVIGREPTCAIRMNGHKRASAIFDLAHDPDRYLYDLEEGALPLCKIVGVAPDGRRVTCARAGYTWTVDRNGFGNGWDHLKDLGDILYTGMNCTGDIYVKDGVDQHVYYTEQIIPGITDQFVSVSVDYDDYNEPPGIWSAWAEGLGCLNFNDRMFGFTGHEVVTLPASVPVPFLTHGGSWIADRGISVGPGGPLSN